MNQNRNNTRRGAAAVEFAIAITILMLIVFTAIEFTRISMLKHSVEYASYRAARKGIIVGADTKDIRAAAQEHLDLLRVTNASISVNPSKITDDTQIVTVLIDVPVSGNSWVSPIYFSGSIKGKTRMLAERAAADMATALSASP